MNSCLKSLFFTVPLKTLVLNQGKRNLNHFRYGSNVAQLFKSTALIKPDGTSEEGSKLLKDKVTAIYFSASWCGPCKQFTPHLKKFYDTVNKNEKKIEVIFVSLDKSKNSMEKYYNENMGTWLRTEYDSELTNALAEECNVTTIPSLKVVKNNGDILNIQAREDIMMHGKEDCEGLLQKWKKIAA